MGKKKTATSVYDDPMNDIGDYPALEAYLQWKFNTEVAASRELVKTILEWPDPREGVACLRFCQSPAERLFLVGFLLKGCGTEGTKWCSDEDHKPKLLAVRFQGETFLVIPQSADQHAEIRPDFAVEHVGPVKGTLCVEIDGHEFHERTPEQASRDRQRDRALTLAGHRVIRFTGSEVYRDPAGCAREVLLIAAAWAQLVKPTPLALPPKSADSDDEAAE